jgi:2-oxoisovalerate dehydrogenase E2 component (dihydrolipoyl transacylase)
MKIFVLPDLGEGLQEAEIVAWRVAVGDSVVSDQPLVAVETDKALVEVPSPRAGRITKLFGEPGDVLRVGAPLVEFEQDDAVSDAGTIVGAISHAAAAAATPQTGGRRIVAKRTPGGAAPPRPKAAPAVRELARRLGVSLEGLAGNGPGGTIMTEDVERAASEQVGYEALHGPRRAMAANMSRAQSEVARTTVVDEADIESWSPDTDVTIRLVRAVIVACRAEPALNAWYDARAGGRIVHDRVDLGLAVDTADGLFVPVLHHAESLAAGDVRKQIDAHRAAAQQRTLSAEDLRGATITLSNFGMLAGRFAALMIVPPQVAIVGAGRIERRVVPAGSGDAAVVHRVLPLSLTFDHRAVTGGEAARFLAAALTDLERGC